MRFVAALLLTVACQTPAQAAADAPLWYANGGVHREGASLMVTCSGTGPAADIARRAAVQACNAMAAEFMSGSYRVRAVTIETDAASAYHSEATTDLDATGLVCGRSREADTEIQGEHQAFLECRYDTRKAHVARREGPKETNKEKGEPVAVVEDDPGSRGTASIEEKPIIQSDEKTLLITVLPGCDSILVRGRLPRVVKCSSRNPLPLLVHLGDSELIVRGSKGYLPKHVKLKPRRGLASAEDLTLQVTLERR